MSAAGAGAGRAPSSWAWFPSTAPPGHVARARLCTTLAHGGAPRRAPRVLARGEGRPEHREVEARRCSLHAGSSARRARSRARARKHERRPRRHHSFSLCRLCVLLRREFQVRGCALAPRHRSQRDAAGARVSAARRGFGRARSGSHHRRGPLHSLSRPRAAMPRRKLRPVAPRFQIATGLTHAGGQDSAHVLGARGVVAGNDTSSATAP